MFSCIGKFWFWVYKCFCLTGTSLAQLAGIHFSNWISIKILSLSWSYIDWSALEVSFTCILCSYRQDDQGTHTHTGAQQYARLVFALPGQTFVLFMFVTTERAFQCWPVDAWFCPFHLDWFRSPMWGSLSGATLHFGHSWTWILELQLWEGHYSVCIACVDVSMYVSMYVSICMYMYDYVRIYVYMCMCMCIYIFMYVNVYYVYIYYIILYIIYICICLCVCICLYSFVYVYMCAYVCICMHVYSYVCMLAWMYAWYCVLCIHVCLYLENMEFQWGRCRRFRQVRFCFLYHCNQTLKTKGDRSTASNPKFYFSKSQANCKRR